MKIIFAGTPAVAIPVLRRLYDSHHEIVGVLTRPAAKQGRGRSLQDSAVALQAENLNLSVIRTSHPDATAPTEQLQSLGADLGVVVAYGALLSPPVLSIPRLGWINLHFSDLPRWRGAAPVQHAIRALDKQTATSVFQLEKGLDTGPVFSKLTVELTGTETAGSLLDELAQLGAEQVLSVVNGLQDGTATSLAQDLDGLTLAPRLTKNDGFVDFHQPANIVDALIRSVSPNPGAWTAFGDGKTLRLGPPKIAIDPASSGPGQIISERNRLLVGTADGVLELDKVAPAGKGWMTATAWWRGARLAEDTILGGTNV